MDNMMDKILDFEIMQSGVSLDTFTGTDDKGTDCKSGYDCNWFSESCREGYYTTD